MCYGPQPMLSAGIDDYANEQDVVDCAKIYARTALRLMNPSLECCLHQHRQRTRGFARRIEHRHIGPF